MTTSEGTTATWVAPFELKQSESLAYEQAIETVEAALRLGIDPSLEPMRALVAELGHPERAFASIQVAGTNGKTSTSRYTAALLESAGHTCALYTSPHLERYNERFEISGKPVGDEELAISLSYALRAWSRLVERGDERALGGCTEFELLTCAAFVLFARAGVDVVVFEVGLGGRWDATSVCNPCAVAVTGIGLDHMKLLGDTLEAIALEKAAVIQQGRSCVLGADSLRPQGVLDVMLSRAREQGVVPCGVFDACEPLPEGTAGLPTTRFTVVSQEPGPFGSMSVDVALEVSLATSRRDATEYETATELYRGIELTGGRYQAHNASCALALAAAFEGAPIDPLLAGPALTSCHVPGRFEVLSKDPLVIIDACHNPQSAAAFADALVHAFPEREHRPPLLIGALADKDYEGIVATVVPLFDRVYVTQSMSERAVPTHELARCIRDVTHVEPVGVYDDCESALNGLYGESFIGCGTITLIGEIRERIRPLLVNSSFDV